MLKWVGDEAIAFIQDLFSMVMDQGMPKEWIENWIKPIHKVGERNILDNYHTIMVGSTMAKLL